MEKNKRNIFKPFMLICLSLVAVTLLGASLIDPPGKPRQVEIVDWSRDQCTIKFKPPRSDGGSPITAYHVEYRYHGGKWQNGPEDLSYEITVTNLIEGRLVSFRVSAINKAGEGKPSDESREVLLMD